MSTYNVRQSIVALVEASSEAEAILMLRRSLARHGFESFGNGDAFEPEPLDFTPDALP